MECERGRLVSPIEEVPVIEGEIVTAIRELADRGWGSKAIARELGVARNTVRRYRRQPIAAGQQVRAPRRLTADVAREAETLYTGVAERNAVVVHRLLREDTLEFLLGNVNAFIIYRAGGREARMREASLLRDFFQRSTPVGIRNVMLEPGGLMQPQERRTGREWWTCPTARNSGSTGQIRGSNGPVYG